jgi:peroxiredoxin Q/BCP
MLPQAVPSLVPGCNSCGIPFRTSKRGPRPENLVLMQHLTCTKGYEKATKGRHMTGIAELGAPAPDFTLPADNGGTVSLSSLRGSKVVLYFYPKADTPGCTQQAIDFNRLKPEFESSGTVVLGVSAGPVNAEEKFKAKYNLTFPLVSDPSHKMLEAYGVWAEKSMFGRKYMGIERTTFLIAPDGRIARVWPKVKVPGHADEVLAAAKAL